MWTTFIPPGSGSFLTIPRLTQSMQLSTMLMVIYTSKLVNPLIKKSGILQENNFSIQALIFCWCCFCFCMCFDRVLRIRQTGDVRLTFKPVTSMDVIRNTDTRSFCVLYNVNFASMPFLVLFCFNGNDLFKTFLKAVCSFCTVKENDQSKLFQQKKFKKVVVQHLQT